MTESRSSDVEISDDLHYWFSRVGGYRAVGNGWTRVEWERCPLEEVPLDQLVATNRVLFPHRVRHHLRTGARPDYDWPPSVVHQDGAWFLIEGHHRAVAAMIKHQTHLAARVMRPKGAG